MIHFPAGQTRPSLRNPTFGFRSQVLVVCLLAAGLGCPVVRVSAQSNENIQPVSELKKLSLEDLLNIDVTSVNKTPERLATAPSAIQVITDDQIHRSGAMSLPEALRLADNLDVAQVTAGSWAISSRGFNASVGNKLLVLMDGRTIYTPLLSGVIWNMQDYLMEDIDRVEVISGPGGTLWGANAVNGVINITSKNARDTQGLYAEAGGGTQWRDFIGVRYGGALNSNVFFRVYGKYFDREGLVYADGSKVHDALTRGQGGFRLDDEVSAQDLWTVQGDFYDGKTHVTPGGEGMPHAVGSAGGGNVLSRWTHTFADDSDMQLQLYYDRTHLGAPFQSSGTIPAGELFDDLDTIDVDFQDRFRLGPWNRIIWGLGYRFTHDEVKNSPLVAFFPTTLDQHLFSGFLQNEINLFDDVFFTVGSKIEHNDYTGFEFEPSARLQWKITDKHMLWGAVSRAVRTPARYDRDLNQPNPAFGTLVGGNSTFQSETVLAYELGYRAQIARQVSASVSTFYNTYDHLRSLGLTGGTGLPAIFENNLEGETYGVEVASDYQPLNWWRLHAGYDFLKEDIRLKHGRIDLFHALNETADPQNQVFLRSSMDLPGRMELDMAGRWIDAIHNNDGPRAGSVASYAELDVRLGWHATKNLELSVVGQNLLHARHAESGFPGPAQEQVVRSVYGKIAWQF